MTAIIVTGYVIRIPSHFHAYDLDTTPEDDHGDDEAMTEQSSVSTAADDNALHGCYDNRLITEDEGESLELQKPILELYDDRECPKSGDPTVLALAVGLGGVWLMRSSSGELLDRLAPMDATADCHVYGAKFLRVAGQRKLAVLALLQSSRRWFLRIYSIVSDVDGHGRGLKIDVDDVQCVDCPIGAAAAVAAATIAVDVPRHDAGWRLRIAAQRGVVFLLGCTRGCSAIWALALPNLKWKTILVERSGGAALRSPLLMRMRPPDAPRPTIIGANAQFPISSAAAAAQEAAMEAPRRRRDADNDDANLSPPPDAFTGFDVGEWHVASDFRRSASCAETRFLLCEAAKSRLNILRLSANGRIESRVVKTKRSKELGWIVRGPQLAIWDEEKDVIVFDASGKLFCFGGVDYRIRRVLADFGRHEVTALAARAGWCFAADATGRCIHALRYRTDADYSNHIVDDA